MVAAQSCGRSALGIAYHANSVIKSDIFQIARRDEQDRYLHLIAFIAHQYFRLQDHLVDVLITSLQGYQNSALREHKDQCYARREQRNPALTALVGYLDEKLLSALATIRAIADDHQLNDAEKVERIRTLLTTHEASVSYDEVKLAALKRGLESELSEDDYYRILEVRSVRIQNRISPIIKTMSFQGETSCRELLAAIQCFKDKDGVMDKTTPLGFLKPVEREAVTNGGKFRVSLYKVLLFLHIQNALKSGTLNLQHSYKYRPLDDYLIERERWRRGKNLLLERAGLEALADPRKVLDDLDEALHAQYLTTNRNILDGKNPFIKFGQKGAFSLATPTQEESGAEPLPNFFPERPCVPLLEVLATVNRYRNFLDEFQHWQQRHQRARPSPKAF